MYGVTNVFLIHNFYELFWMRGCDLLGHHFCSGVFKKITYYEASVLWIGYACLVKIVHLVIVRWNPLVQQIKRLALLEEVAVVV